jgi:hypothetical protein
MNDMNLENIDTIISDAIAHHLGNIGDLPEIAQSRIRRVYKAFYTAYLEIAQLKGLPKHPESWKAGDLDSDIVESMQHFFSDYQNLYREFIALNRHARTLMRIDPQKNPAEFEERLNAFVSGKDDSSSRAILKELLTPQDLDG